MKAFPIVVNILLILLLLAGVVLPTEATNERGSSANTTLQAQPGKHHVQKVSHTEGVGSVSYTDTHCSYTEGLVDTAGLH